MGFLIGFFINLQFFTPIPVKRQLPMDKKYIHRAIQTFPLIGLFSGLILSSVLYLLIEWTPFSLLSISFVIWLLTIILTGGLHLDGWMDTSDAFFSYQDKEKRLEIMKDPRTGAFGVISVIVLLSTRFLFIYEIIEHMTEFTYVLIVFIPFLSKCVMGILLCRMPLAKEEGLGAFFQSAVQKNSLYIYCFYLVFMLAIALWIGTLPLYLTILMTGITILCFYVLKRKIIAWFGGITGDILGASVEGVELVLWMTVWLLHYFAMG